MPIGARVAIRKWWALFAIFVQDGIAYRASGIIWILTDLTTAITMPLVWAAASSGGPIAGLRTSDFVLYYLGMLILGSFVNSHIMWEVAIEIREGIFSTYLIRPISFYQYTFFRNLSWRCIRMAFTVPFLIALLALYRSFLEGATVYLGWELWASMVLGHLVSFVFVMAMGMIALFTQEAMAVFELYYVPHLFLSGYLFPLSLLPSWAQSASKWMPFYYTAGAPTEILIGKLEGPESHKTLMIQAVWIVVIYAVSQVLWRKGLKYYTGVGM